jgi:hypothetical protein
MTWHLRYSFHARLIVFGAISVGLMARAATFQSPLFDFHSWRQADTATVARNFVEERLNPLYPQVDFRGDQAVGYVETGFELHAFLVALAASVVGFSTHLGRALSILSFPFSAWLIGAFVRERYGQTAAVVAIVLYAVGLPLTRYVDRAFMNESLLTLLTLVCLRAAQVYLRSGRPWPLATLAASMVLIAVVKPTFLIVGAPVGGLFVERFGARGVWRWELWAVASACVGAAAAWFLHAHRLFEATGLTFGLTNKLFDAELLVSWAYFSKIGTRTIKDLLSPVGMAAAIYGLAVVVRERRWAEPLGIAAFLLYLVVVTPGNFAHNYYQLPVVPVATVLMAVGIVEAVRVQGDRRSWSEQRRMAVIVGVLWLAAVSTFVRNASFHSWYEVDQSRVRICQELVRSLAPEQRVAFANYGSPDILFCVDRTGWLLDDRELTEQRFSELLAGGAVIVTETRFAETVQLLATLGVAIATTPEFVAYGATR